MPKIQALIIDEIQTINRSISGIESAPDLEDYPLSVENAHLPLCLTDFAEPNLWRIRLSDGRLDLNIRIRVFVASIANQRISNITQRIIDISDNLRLKYRDNGSYLYDDDTKTFINNNNQIAHIDISQEFEYSGPTLIEEPEGSESWYHGFSVIFPVVAFDS